MQEQFNLLHLENRIWIVTRKIDLAVYDYEFERGFACHHPHVIPEDGITAIARLGAAQDYEKRYEYFKSLGIKLIHTPEQYLRSSELPQWYPVLSDLTPRSAWYESPPPTKEVETQFGWPVFIKGQRQTSRHQRKLSIVETPEQYEKVCAHWDKDDVLHWQQMVCREYIPLQPVADDIGQGLPKSYEFRCFCWKGKVAAIGNYWFSETYQPKVDERQQITELAELAAIRLDLPFLVIDIAKTLAGDWIIIECNDGQDSGYAGINPMIMWSAILNTSKSPR